MKKMIDCTDCTYKINWTGEGHCYMFYKLPDVCGCNPNNPSTPDFEVSNFMSKLEQYVSSRN